MMIPGKKRPASGPDDTGAVMALMTEKPDAEEEEEEGEGVSEDPLAAIAKVEAALAELKQAISR